MLKYIIVISALFYFLPFCLSVAISLSKKGMSAFRWTPGMMKSGMANTSIGVINLLIAPAIYFLNDGARQVYAMLNIPHIPPEFWAGFPILIILSIAVIGQDFADYWNHRLLHLPGLWPIHAVHHSDPDMNHTTSLRLHILESFVMTASYTVILSWLGLPAIAAASLVLFHSLYNKFVHIDVDIHLGPLVRWIATPRFHQWHHANVPEAIDKNFANIFSFWDVVFGTYYVPGRCSVPLGIENSPNHNLIKLLLWPFLEWGRTVSEGVSDLRRQTA